jgi:agmatinase
MRRNGSMDRGGEMPYVGISTFLKAPYVEELAELEADVAFLGIPFDEATGNRSGTRFGPRALREASSLYAQYHMGEGFFDIELKNWVLNGVMMADVGDVPIQPLALESNHHRMSDKVKGILDRGALPVSVGGDHSITFPVVQGFSEIGEFGLIQVDTHADVLHFPYESELTHSSPIINIARHCPFVTNFVQIGMRGLTLDEQNYEASKDRGNQIISADEVHDNGVDWVLDHIVEMPYYVTFDIDSMDPSIAPGTGTPEPGGLLYRQARNLLRGIAQKGPIVGIDMVEVNPLYDPADGTSLLASRLLIDFLGAIFNSDHAPSRTGAAGASA